MIASSFATHVTAPPSFPANLQSPPTDDGNVTPPIQESLFEMWRAAMLTPAITMLAMQKSFQAAGSKNIIRIFDADVFKSYFEPIPGALNALSSEGLKPIIPPMLHDASMRDTQLCRGVYIEVSQDKSFILYLSNANGRGIAAEFEHNDDILNYYTLKNVATSKEFGALEATQNFETSQELDRHFQTMIKDIDQIIAFRKPPEPKPPGGGITLMAA